MFGALVAVPGAFVAGMRTGLVVAAALLTATALSALRIAGRAP